MSYTYPEPDIRRDQLSKKFQNGIGSLKTELRIQTLAFEQLESDVSLTSNAEVWTSEIMTKTGLWEEYDEDENGDPFCPDVEGRRYKKRVRRSGEALRTEEFTVDIGGEINPLAPVYLTGLAALDSPTYYTYSEVEQTYMNASGPTGGYMRVEDEVQSGDYTGGFAATPDFTGRSIIRDVIWKATSQAEHLHWREKIEMSLENLSHYNGSITRSATGVAATTENPEEVHFVMMKREYAVHDYGDEESYGLEADSNLVSTVTSIPVEYPIWGKRGHFKTVADALDPVTGEPWEDALEYIQYLIDQSLGGDVFLDYATRGFKYINLSDQTWEITLKYTDDPWFGSNFTVTHILDPYDEIIFSEDVSVFSFDVKVQDSSGVFQPYDLKTGDCDLRLFYRDELFREVGYGSNNDSVRTRNYKLEVSYNRGECSNDVDVILDEIDYSISEVAYTKYGFRVEWGMEDIYVKPSDQGITYSHTFALTGNGLSNLGAPGGLYPNLVMGVETSRTYPLFTTGDPVSLTPSINTAESLRLPATGFEFRGDRNGGFI